MSKFRFWLNYTNGRSEKGYGSSLTDGYAVHARGWDAGVEVTPRVRGREDVSAAEYADADEFDVSMTWGSNGSNRSVHLGTVRDTAGGPVWIPESDVCADYLDTSAPARLQKHRRPREHTPRAFRDPESAAYPIAAEPEPEDILSRIDSALADRPLDPIVFGPGY